MPSALPRLPVSLQFRPRLIDALQGYNRDRFTRDVGAGLTVGVVALPLAMAFAIASGLPPQAGLWTAIIAGLLISLLGGSSVQIGGPAGAFIVIVYGIIQRYGVSGLIIATTLSGVLLFLMGMFKLGTLIRFIPIAVVIGFTNGIAVLIGLSQVKDFLGLNIANMPASFFGMIGALRGALHTFNPQALGVALVSLAIIVLWQKFSPRLATLPVASGAAGAETLEVAQQASATRQIAGSLNRVPGSIVALLVVTAATALLRLNVETIGSKFGGIPSSVPGFAMPPLDWETARFLLMPTLTLALLGAIESLLCARVADGMVGERHNPNQELMAQGVANFFTPFFGGMPATGTIARTVTNIKSGASSPIAGVVHAATLLLVVLVAAPLAAHIPLATLAAVLMFVAWNMGEWREFVHLRQYRMPYRATLLAVFLLTVIFDLTVAVEVGLVAACLTFIYRISSLSRSEAVTPEADARLAGRAAQVQAWRIYGALFFGAVKLIERLEDQLPQQALVIDLKNVIYIDSSGADTLLDLAKTCQKKQVRLIVCGLANQPQDIARRSGLLKAVGDANLAPTLKAGLDAALGADAGMTDDFAAGAA